MTACSPARRTYYPSFTGGETEAQSHMAGYADSGFLHQSFTLASWTRVTPEKGSQDAPTFPEAAVPWPA